MDTADERPATARSVDSDGFPADSSDSDDDLLQPKHLSEFAELAEGGSESESTMRMNPLIGLNLGGSERGGGGGGGVGGEVKLPSLGLGVGRSVAAEETEVPRNTTPSVPENEADEGPASHSPPKLAPSGLRGVAGSGSPASAKPAVPGLGLGLGLGQGGVGRPGAPPTAHCSSDEGGSSSDEETADADSPKHNSPPAAAATSPAPNSSPSKAAAMGKMALPKLTLGDHGGGGGGGGGAGSRKPPGLGLSFGGLGGVPSNSANPSPSGASDSGFSSHSSSSAPSPLLFQGGKPAALSLGGLGGGQRPMGLNLEALRGDNYEQPMSELQIRREKFAFFEKHCTRIVDGGAGRRDWLAAPFHLTSRCPELLCLWTVGCGVVPLHL